MRRWEWVVFIGLLVGVIVGVTFMLDPTGAPDMIGGIR